MRKFLSLILLFGASLIFIPTVEAKTNGSLNLNHLDNPQVRVRIGHQRRHRVRTYYRTRVVRYGYRFYRETYRVMYLPNGRVKTQLIRRVRIR